VSSAVVETRALSKRYGSVTAVAGVDLSVRRGEIYGFLGPNGAGKTTTLRMLVGLVRPTSGSAQVLGHAPGRPAALTRIGAMIEGPGFYPYLSGRDNLRLVARLSGIPAAAVDPALETVDLAGRASDRFSTYSMGMKQRLGVAAALLKHPELVILDEPTNGLDPAGREEMLTLVRRLSAELGIAVIMSSHVLEDVVRTCDAVVVLRAGHVAATRTLTDASGASEREARVVVTGDTAAFVARLEAAGLTASLRDDHVLVSGPDADTMLRAVRDAAADTEAGLHELRPAGPTLEDALIGDLT
jgi:ABC-2 type transport system ATP-binding protein